MIFPTIRTLQWLERYASVEAVLNACAGEGQQWVSCPRVAWRDGKEERFMEHELEFGELELVCPDGQLRHALDWQSEHPVPLLKNVQRLTAPNKSFMTGPGTNSYIVGDIWTGYAVIDPGPNDASHLQRLRHAAGGDIQMIVCTHSHPDHSPGAAVLQRLCVNRPPILGLPSQPTARPHSQFVPDRSLADGEQLQLYGQSNHGQRIAHTLEVIHTPGHAANHLCLILREDGLLFSGDHVLNGFSPVIDPPDGNMTDYLNSLDKLDAACAATGAQFVLPAHGYVMNYARTVIAQLKAHRLAREAKVLAAMKAKPDGSVDDWVAMVYRDTPRSAWTLATRSVLAHVERIRSLQLA